MKITAALMRTIASEKHSNISAIEAEIIKTAEKGENILWWHEHISKEDRGRLTTEGFGVGKEQDDRGDILTQITW